MYRFRCRACAPPSAFERAIGSIRRSRGLPARYVFQQMYGMDAEERVQNWRRLARQQPSASIRRRHGISRSAVSARSARFRSRTRELEMAIGLDGGFAQAHSIGPGLCAAATRGAWRRSTAPSVPIPMTPFMDVLHDRAERASL